MRKSKKKFGPVTAILVTTLVVMIITSILSLMGFDGQKTIIAATKLETYLVTVKNIFSLEGIKFLLTDSFSSFLTFKPVLYLVVSLITVGIMEASGLIKIIADKFKRLKFKYLTMLVMIISLIFTFFGDYSFVLLIPIIASVYKHIGRNPILGIVTVFVSLTLGYGLGFMYNYNEYTLGKLTEIAARVEVDKTFSFTSLSNIYIMIASSIILIIFASTMIDEKIAAKFKNPEIELEELNVSKVALQKAAMVFLLCILIVIYSIIPGSNYTGFLLDRNEVTYLGQLFGPNAIFGLGLPYIIMLIAMLCSYAYGKFSGNISGTFSYNEALSSSFSKMGYLFVLMFFISQLISIINWTNIGEVLTANILTFISSVEFSGVPLLFLIFIVVIFMSILIPNVIDKWTLLSPVVVPLLMRSNITPNMTQFTVELADGAGKMLTPLFPYYIIMLGFIYKYKEKNEISLFETTRLLMPLTLAVTGIYLLIILCWFIIGLPLGIETFPSL